MYRQIKLRNGLTIVEVDNAVAISASIGRTQSYLDSAKNNFSQGKRALRVRYKGVGPDALPPLWRERYPTYNKFWEACLAGQVSAVSPSPYPGWIRDYEQQLVCLDAELVLFQTGELRGCVPDYVCDSQPSLVSDAIACTFCLNVPPKIRCLSTSTDGDDEFVGICHTCWPALYDAALPGAVAPEEDV